jgi:large subunit ribosomal protein L3
MTAVTKGVLGEKVGMTQVYDDQSRVIPVTVIRVGPCYVTQVKTNASDGYSAIQMSFGSDPERKVTKPQLGHFKKAGVSPSRHVDEIRVADASSFEVGQELKADIFAKGERADVSGVSKGKGFAGVMKRHGFAGLESSHGTQRAHRKPGSIGACATPSRVFKGMPMAGLMGHERVTTLNLEIVEADAERGFLLIRGAVPGPNGSVVMVRNAIKGGGK